MTDSLILQYYEPLKAGCNPHYLVSKVNFEWNKCFQVDLLGHKSAILKQGSPYASEYFITLYENDVCTGRGVMNSASGDECVFGNGDELSPINIIQPIITPCNITYYSDEECNEYDYTRGLLSNHCLERKTTYTELFTIDNTQGNWEQNIYQYDDFKCEKTPIYNVKGNIGVCGIYGIFSIKAAIVNCPHEQQHYSVDEVLLT